MDWIWPENLEPLLYNISFRCRSEEQELNSDLYKLSRFISRQKYTQEYAKDAPEKWYGNKTYYFIFGPYLLYLSLSGTPPISINTEVGDAGSSTCET